MEYVDTKKQDYALLALKLAEDNHIWINAVWPKDSIFFENLWRMVYRKLDNGHTLPSISFWKKTNMKLPWSITFISLNQS
jgi:hypothetical protein